MRWADRLAEWTGLVPDPRQIDRFGGVRMTVAETSPAIQRRLRAFGRQVPVRREHRGSRRRSALRHRLRLAAGLLALAVLVLVGRRG